MLPILHVRRGLARWVVEASGLAEAQVLTAQAAVGRGPAGPYLAISRLGVVWDGPARSRHANEGAPGWALDFTGFTPGDPVALRVFGRPLLVETDPGDSASDARDAWAAALEDLDLGELVVFAAGGPGLATLTLTADAPRGFLHVSEIQGCAVTPDASTGSLEVTEQTGRIVYRVTAYNFEEALAAEKVLGRVRGRVGSRAWSDRSRSYLRGAQGVIAEAGNVTPIDVRAGADFDTRAYLDLEVEAVWLGPAEDADLLADIVAEDIELELIQP